MQRGDFIRTNEIPEEATKNSTIFDSYVKAKSVLTKYDSAMASISGGADSDVVLDILARLDADRCIRYVWFNTGLEYKATRDHLDFLEEKYGIEIERVRPKKSVPTCCKEYGQPFVSKYISQRIHSLQINNFDWSYIDFDKMQEKCGFANAMFWNNQYGGEHKKSSFNINRNKYLKEFLIANPPTFNIDSKCCDWTKKRLSKSIYKKYNVTLDITGVRKSEGGVRAQTYTNCYSMQKDGINSYRPIFWYTNKDKDDYKRLFNIKNSDCYEVWGFTRTGCVGCPYNRKLEYELAIAQQYEPQLYKACNNIFSDSYKYTKLYRDYAVNRKELEKYKLKKGDSN